MNITQDIKYIGVNDRDIDLFEGQYIVPNGMAYNSYVITDDKIAVMDTVDARFKDEWLSNLEKALDGKNPDYLIIQHMEPDHSANIRHFAEKYPNAKIVSSSKSFVMMKGFFGTDFVENQIVVGEGDALSLGSHTLTFITAPMVHWPEVIVTYDSKDKVLFYTDIITSCLASPVLVSIVCTEFTEAVGREKHLILGIVGYDNLGPMYHWCCYKSKGVASQ